LLPTSLLAFDVQRGVLVPRLLTGRDEPWVQSVLDHAVAWSGATRGAWRAAVQSELRPRAVSLGATWRAAAGVLCLLERGWRARVDSPAPPANIRRTVFERAAQTADPARALALAAEDLSLDAPAILAHLFADRRDRHVLSRACADWPSSRALVEEYNLRLVQGILRHARALTVHIGTHVRAVVRYAKLRRLLCTYALTPEGTAVHVSGPLAVLRQTTKYGHALASFVESALSTAGWTLFATCEFGAEPAVLRLSADAPLLRRHALPRPTDSAVERRFAADVRALGTDWRVERETAAIPVIPVPRTDALAQPTQVFFPDFTLVRGEARVLVEIVGYYTEEYLASKLRALRHVEQPIVVCVDDALELGGVVDAAEIVRFRKRIDARAVLAAAERLVASAAFTRTR
jgi:uncharacterized protein